MRYRLALMIAVCFPAAPGCLYHGYYPNGYYGTGPTVLPAQPWTGYPNGPVMQPGSPYYQPNNAPIYQPGGGSPTPIDGSTPFYQTPPGGSGQPPNTTDPNNPQTYQPGNAPTFNSDPNKKVPVPDDDNFGRGSGGANRSPLITPTSGANAPNNDVSTPFGPEARLQRQSEDENAADETFAAPVLQASASSDSDTEQPFGQQPPARVKPKTYAHDPKFEWVQGIVEFDERSNSWIIMYDDNPSRSDPYGGELSIAGDLSRVRLRQGDTVRIDGAIDQSEVDARGKPVFQAAKLRKL